MAEFHNENVLKLLGVMVDESHRPILVTEFMKNGDLAAFLRDEENVRKLSMLSKVWNNSGTLSPSSSNIRS